VEHPANDRERRVNRPARPSRYSGPNLTEELA
jgi:hypothetical protein